MAGPLEGIRVVDLSSMLSGPWAADILGDQGADVVKVEPPGVGDHVRLLPNRSGDLPAMFVNINRSKRSVTLNLKSDDGVAALLRLYETADVVVQNFRPGVVDRLGIGYEDARRVNPRLVYLSISGFGEEGPYAGRRVYDPVVQALSGLTTIQAGSDEARPRLIRTVLPDKLTSVTAAQAVTAALRDANVNERQLGIVFAGIDVIGDRLTEVNVTSPTGIREIDALSGSDLPRLVVEALERSAEDKRRTVE